MSDTIYEILIRGNPNGTVSGAHVARWQSDGTDRNGVARFVTGNPEPIDVADLAGLLSAQSAALVAQIAELQARIAAMEASPAA